MPDISLALECVRDDQIDKLWHWRRGKVRMSPGEIAGAKGKLGRRPFVKEVVGVDHAGRPVKKAVQGRKSYLDAIDDIGKRGVKYWFTLKPGRCYQIQEALSHNRARRYFAIAAEDGRLVEVTGEMAAGYVITRAAA